MPMKKDLKLDQYDISPYAYRELHNFCLQYPEKKRRLRELESPFGGPRGSDPTAGRATRAATLAADIALIEKTARPGGGRAGPLSGGGGDRGHALALPAHAQGPAAGRKKLQRHPPPVLLPAGQGKADRVKGARSYTQNARPLEQEGQAQSY